MAWSRATFAAIQAVVLESRCGQISTHQAPDVTYRSESHVMPSLCALFSLAFVAPPGWVIQPGQILPRYPLRGPVICFLAEVLVAGGGV